MQVVILNNPDAVAEYGAQLFIKQLIKKNESVLGLATGSTPVALYQKLIAANKKGKVSFKKSSSFNLDEYLGLEGDHPQSYRYFMQQQLFDHIDIDPAQTFVPAGNTDDPIEACRRYEAMIREKGGIDIQLLGIGSNGHIGFNEPSSGLMSRTRVKTLAPATIRDNARFFSRDEEQPHLSITMGIGTILDSHQTLLLATGEAKAEAIAATVEGPLTASCPASALQMHPNAVIVIDEGAANQLKNTAFYKHVEQENLKLKAKLGL